MQQNTTEIKISLSDMANTSSLPVIICRCYQELIIDTVEDIRMQKLFAKLKCQFSSNELFNNFQAGNVALLWSALTK